MRSLRGWTSCEPKSGLELQGAGVRGGLKLGSGLPIPGAVHDAGDPDVFPHDPVHDPIG